MNDSSQEDEILTKLNIYLKNPIENVEEILKIMPDNYKYWSILKERLLKMKSNSKNFIETCKSQYELTNTCIEENPKSYQVWYHREFIMKNLCEQGLLDDLIKKDEEFLMMSILSHDDRNFHCYGYMRFLGIGKNLFIQLFKNNVENYSALHELIQIYERMGSDKNLNNNENLNDHENLNNYSNNRENLNNNENLNDVENLNKNEDIFDIKALILKNPENEGLWLAYTTKKEIDRKTHIKLFREYFTIIFEKPFSDELLIFVERKSKKIKINVNVEFELPFIKINFKISLNDKIEIIFNGIRKKFLFIYDQIVDPFIEKVLEINGSCKFALLEKLNVLNKDERGIIIEKLIEIDTIRKEYYEMIRNDEIHILRELE
ncbi:Geranylgeranyl transferase type-2 subunit alpha [Dictyocoela muelleri]|nr:Geranylgeranyl transferase type-2 subunit alpha [Dictyocoela muelleri]